MLTPLALAAGELGLAMALLLAAVLAFLAALAYVDARRDDTAAPVDDWLAGAGVLLLVVGLGIVGQWLLSSAAVLGAFVVAPNAVSIVVYTGVGLLLFWWLRGAGVAEEVEAEAGVDVEDADEESTG